MPLIQRNEVASFAKQEAARINSQYLRITTGTWKPRHRQAEMESSIRVKQSRLWKGEPQFQEEDARQRWTSHVDSQFQEIAEEAGSVCESRGNIYSRFWVVHTPIVTIPGAHWKALTEPARDSIYHGALLLDAMASRYDMMMYRYANTTGTAERSLFSDAPNAL